MLCWNKVKCFFVNFVIRQFILNVKKKHINSKSDKHKTQYGTVVKEYDTINPHIDEVNYIPYDAIKGFRDEKFII